MEHIKYKYRDVINYKSKPKRDEWDHHAQNLLIIYNGNYAEYAAITPSVHKILVHGRDTINFFDLGPGYYSKQSQEKMNKIIRQTMERHTRKLSFEAVMRDILVYLYM